MNTKIQGLSCLYSAILLLALNGLFAKSIPLDALSITQMRSTLAAAIFFLLAGVRRRPLNAPNRIKQLGLFGLGFLLGIHWVTFFHAMQVSSVAVGMLSLFSFPVITILLEPLFVHKQLQAKDLVAGIIALGGVGIMVSQGLVDNKGAVIAGVAWGILSALLFSLRNLFQKYSYSEVASDCLMYHQVLAIALFLLPWVNVKAFSRLDPQSWLLVAALALFSTATAHTLLTISLKRLPVKSASLIACLQPVIAGLLAWAVMEEIPGRRVVIGGLVILGVSVYETLQQRA